MTFSFCGGEICYSDSGSGKTIVLLHGYLESSEIWGSFAFDLAGKFRVLAVDLPGHGRSSVYGEIHTMEFMARAVKELLVSLGVEKAVLAGHSLGGYVTLAFLDLFPEMLSAYCLIHSHPHADSKEATEKRRREIAIVRAGKKELMYPDNVLRMYATSNLERMAEGLRRSKEIASEIPGEGIIAVLNGMINRPSRLKLMEQGRKPCLWFLGSMDNYIDHRAVQAGIKLPANTSVIILGNSGHMGFLEEPVATAEILTRFADTNS